MTLYGSEWRINSFSKDILQWGFDEHSKAKKLEGPHCFGKIWNGRVHFIQCYGFLSPFSTNFTRRTQHEKVNDYLGVNLSWFLVVQDIISAQLEPHYRCQWKHTWKISKHPDNITLVNTKKLNALLNTAKKLIHKMTSFSIKVWSFIIASYFYTFSLPPMLRRVITSTVCM